MRIRFVGPKAPRVEPENYINVHSWSGPSGQCNIRLYEHTDGSWFGETTGENWGTAHRVYPSKATGSEARP